MAEKKPVAPPGPQPSIADLIAAGPQIAPATSQRSPIGVPAGYSVKRPGQKFSIGGSDTGNILGGPTPSLTASMPGKAAKLYYEEDVVRPATWSPAQTADLQRRMAAVGLFGKKPKYRNAVWDDKSQSAYAKLLGFANAAGLTAQEALDRYSAEGGTDDEDGRGSLVTRTTNAEDLRETFETVLRTKTGRKPDPAKVAQMVATYQSGQIAEQTAEYGMGGTDGAGGNVAQMMAPDTFAKVQAERIDPLGVKVTEAGDTAAEFFGALKALGI